MSRIKRADSLKRLSGRKYVGIIAFMVLALVAMGALFTVVSILTSQEKQYLTKAAELRLLSQTMTKYALEASQGKRLGGAINPFNLLKEAQAQFDKNLRAFVEGDPSTNLPALTTNAEGKTQQSALKEIESLWKIFEPNLKVVLDGEAAIEAVNRSVANVNQAVPEMTAESFEVLSVLVDNNARPTQIQKASIQLMLLERINANANKILALQSAASESSATKDAKKSKSDGQETDAESSIGRIRRDTAIFNDTLRGMLQGDKDLGIQKIVDREAVNNLNKVRTNFEVIGKAVSDLVKHYTKVANVHNAANKLTVQSDKLFEKTRDLIEFLREKTRFSETLNYLAFAAGGVALLMLVFLGYRLVNDTSRRSLSYEQQNREQQEAILRLLDEIQGLSEGDLTAQAIVTEDFTGAIADAFNSAIEELRTLVTTINETSVQVSSAAQETQATAMHLAEASDHQAQQITSVSLAVNEMAVSIEEVSKNAKESTKVAQSSVKIANAGVATVRRNILGMDSIREQIQETSKRIKRLGESSQEIGDIIELINDIADQTNILSLNAAIQAAMAGEAGRGFAVVADEVQRLAERSSNATKQIEALVKTIQTDTNEAVISMEQSTANVVKGAKMAEDAGEALAEIENVSNRLAELIHSISENATQQSRVALNVSETMNVIQEITTQTSAGTNETAASIGNLADLANELRKSVSGFRLPDEARR